MCFLSLQLEDALANAPEHLRCLGLAFRAYICAASAGPGSLAGCLVGYLENDWRIFVDPLALQPREDSGRSPNPALGQVEDSQGEPPLLRLAHTVVVVISIGMFDIHRVVSEVNSCFTDQ